MEAVVKVHRGEVTFLLVLVNYFTMEQQIDGGMNYGLSFSKKCYFLSLKSGMTVVTSCLCNLYHWVAK